MKTETANAMVHAAKGAVAMITIIFALGVGWAQGMHQQKQRVYELCTATGGFQIEGINFDCKVSK